MIRTHATTGTLIAPAGIRQFNRITEQTLESFHFHGDPADYPVPAVIVLPGDTRSTPRARCR